MMYSTTRLPMIMEELYLSQLFEGGRLKLNNNLWQKERVLVSY